MPNDSTRQERLQAALGDRYRVEGRVGEGGMASVFLAEDLKHKRRVAIKVLQEELAHTIGIQRFLQEIEVIARLQHPHLLTLIDSGDVDGLPYYVMPYLEGQSLKALLARERRLPLEQALSIIREVADGLQFAHEHGVIHRDIKPANILMSGGHAVVADFGIATALDKAAMDRLTQTGISVGSPTYMSPEQAAGERDLDERTDVYALGCVLYEMLAGAPPIEEASMQLTITRKLTGVFVPIRQVRPEVPGAIEATINKALATDRAGRFESASACASALAAVAPRAAAQPAASHRSWLVRGGVALTIAAALVIWFQYQRRELWAAQQLAEIDRLATAGEFAAAFDRAETLMVASPRTTELLRLRPRFTDYINIVTQPAGASVYRRRLGTRMWELVGRTPVESLVMPKFGLDLMYELRIERDGFETVDLLPHVFADWAEWRGVPRLDTLRLDPVGGRTRGMSRVPGFAIRDTLHTGGGQLRFNDYHMDRREVTNADFQRFVDAKGYAKREYWTGPFVRDGRTLTWEQAVAAFTDRTGMQGPSTWSGGTFPPGQEDFPVGGVSFHEAAAYAKFAGKSLPTSAHWTRASLRHVREASWVFFPAANVAAPGPRKAGQGEMNPYGLFDVAGNVREWCVNTVDGGRLTRGAAWEDADFFITQPIPKPEFDRSATNGLRLAIFTDHDTTIAHLAGPIRRASTRDYARFAVASESEYRIYRRLFDYDSLPLQTRLDTSAVTDQFRWEKVSFTAAYDGERMAAHVFLPRDAKPPYQAVMYWPNSGALIDRVFDLEKWTAQEALGFIPRSGRALIMPVFKGAYERDDSTFNTVGPGRPGSNEERQLIARWIKDFRRTVDYVQTRSDIAPGPIGLYAWSFGGRMAPLAMALEARITAAVLNVGGLEPVNVHSPEVDPANYVSRVRIPVLMLNGRHDVVFPNESSQLPLYRMLGTAAADKKHVVYATSHSVPQEDIVRETLAWFDKYLAAPRR